MSDEDCQCCGTEIGRTNDDGGRETGGENRESGGPERDFEDAREATDDPESAGPLLDDPVDEQLPDPLARRLGAFVGRERVETLGAWADEVEAWTGGPIEVEELCHAGEETAHRGTVDGETHHFLCFYDAVLLAAIEDRPVEVRTESPKGTVIEARVTGDGIPTHRDGAVFSLGIDESVESVGDPTLEHAYAAICPHVRAFPDLAAYEAWAESIQAPTVAVPMAEATMLARMLVE